MFVHALCSRTIASASLNSRMQPGLIQSFTKMEIGARYGAGLAGVVGETGETTSSRLISLVSEPRDRTGDSSADMLQRGACRSDRMEGNRNVSLYN